MIEPSGSDQPSVVLDGVLVSFRRRDVRQATDAEVKRLKELIRTEQQWEGLDRPLEKMIIDSDYLDRDLIRFRTTVHAPRGAIGEEEYE